MANNKYFNSRFQQKHDIEENWKKAETFAPLAGELIIYDPDDNYNYPRFKVGIWDGVSEKTNDMLVNNLPFMPVTEIDDSAQVENGTYLIWDAENHRLVKSKIHRKGVTTIIGDESLPATGGAINIDGILWIDNEDEVHISHPLRVHSEIEVEQAIELSNGNIIASNSIRVGNPDWSDDMVLAVGAGNSDEASNTFIVKKDGTGYLGDRLIVTTEKPSEGLAYILNEDGESYRVTGIGTCTDTDIIIPSVYAGKPVTSISMRAFCNGTFKSITIPNSITSIGETAFTACGGLTSITIPDSVISIGTNAFGNCDNITSVTIGNGVTNIGTAAFYRCSNLKSIVIPDSVTSIGMSAFQGCSSLTSITIPFVGATKDGTSNTHFGYIFGASSSSNNPSFVPTSLKTVVITGGTRISSAAFVQCGQITNVTIPNSVTSIGESAFESCSALVNITLPDTLSYIAGHAIWNCNNLKYNEYDNAYYLGNDNNPYLVLQKAKNTSITSCNINNKTRFIQSSAFASCTNLINVTIPDSIGEISTASSIFSSTIENITMPASAINVIPKANLKTVVITSGTSISSGAFSGCSKLESITLPFVGGSAKTASDTYQYPFGYIFGTSSYTGGVAITQYYYGSSTSSTTNSTYYIPSSLKSVTITGGNILYGAFDNCSSLTSVTIGNGVTSIGSHAFYNCNNLKSVMIPDSVTSIDQNSFLECDDITFYCEAKSQPTGWPAGWNYYGLVVWDCSTNFENLYQKAVFKNTPFNGSITLQESGSNILDPSYTMLNTDKIKVHTGYTEYETIITGESIKANTFIGNIQSASAGITEMYEWSDRNIDNEDRRGRFITLEGDKIRIANEYDEYILGVIDPNPSLIGDAASLEWKDKYLKDVFGSYIYEEVEVPATYDEEGNVITEAITRKQKVLNPEYDETKEYVSRVDRPEFAAITSKGKVVMIDDGTCVANGYATVGTDGTATYSSNNYAVRVLERIDNTHIKVLIDSVFIK